MTANSRWTEIATDAGPMPVYLSLPPAGKGPAVILLEEIFGVNSHIRGVADEYAKAGYVVIAPDIFWRSQPRVELTYSAADRDRGIAFMQQVDFAKTLGDLAACAKSLRAMPEVTGKVTAIGYCFGGRLSYLAAANGLVDAAVPYYGGGIHDQLDSAAQIKVPMLFHYAANDGHIPMEAVDKVKAAFKGHANAHFHVYPGADHGFNCWDRESYNQNAAALAFGRTLQFLAENA